MITAWSLVPRGSVTGVKLASRVFWGQGGFGRISRALSQRIRSTPTRDQLVVERLKGHVEVTRAGGRVTDLGPGDYFGEIALVREVPRSATCTAKTNVELYTIDRERFVSAVTGNSRSASEIESVIHRRLGGLEAVA